MKRTFASVAALALVGMTAAASGASQTYEGEIEGDARATVALDVEGRAGRRIVTEFTVRQFPLECEEATLARLDRARVAGRARVSRKGRFELAASNEHQRLEVRGRVQSGGEVSGKLSYEGRTEFSDRTLDCHAEDLAWTATR